MASIRSQIVANIASVIGAITITGGYGTDLATSAGGGGAFYWMGADLSTTTVPFAVVSALNETESERSLYLQTCSLSVTVDAFGSSVRDEGEDSKVRWEAMDQLIVDIEKALLADPTRSGHAVDTFVDSFGIKPFDGQDGLLVASLNVRVHYRHRFGDPSTAGP